MGNNISLDSGIYLVPEFCQKDSILLGTGNFFNVASVHHITKGIITQESVNARKFFLYIDPK